MLWEWADVRKAIDESNGSFAAFLAKLPRSEIERLLWSNHHRCNVLGNFAIMSGEAAKATYEEIAARAVAAEREACARIADLHRDPEHGTCGSQCLDYCCHEQIAKDIRARGC